MIAPEKTGRRILLFNIVLVMAFALVALGLAAERMRWEMSRLALPAGQVAFLGFLCFWVHRGSPLARLVLTGYLCLLAGISLAVSYQPGVEPFAFGVGYGSALVYLNFARLLIWSENVQAFVEKQKAQKK